MDMETLAELMAQVEELIVASASSGVAEEYSTSIMAGSIPLNLKIAVNFAQAAETEANADPIKNWNSPLSIIMSAIGIAAKQIRASGAAIFTSYGEMRRYNQIAYDADPAGVTSTVETIKLTYLVESTGNQNEYALATDGNSYEVV